jgi:hypothetical protein
MVTSSLGGSPGMVFSPDYELYFARLFVGAVIPLVLLMPVITCFGVDLEKKFWPDGLFRIRRMLIGTPSGGLPYLFTLVTAAVSGVCTFTLWHPGLIGVRFVAYAAFAYALVYAGWSFGRLTSSINNGLRYARTLQFTGLVAAFALPVPFLAMADSWGYSSKDLSAWDLYILRPLFSTEDKTALAVAYSVLMVLVGLIFTRWSESLAKSKYQKMGLSYGTEEN